MTCTGARSNIHPARAGPHMAQTSVLGWGEPHPKDVSPDRLSPTPGSQEARCLAGAMGCWIPTAEVGARSRRREGPGLESAALHLLPLPLDGDQGIGTPLRIQFDGIATNSRSGRSALHEAVQGRMTPITGDRVDG